MSRDSGSKVYYSSGPAALRTKTRSRSYEIVLTIIFASPNSKKLNPNQIKSFSMESETVCAVVVTYNRLALLKECVDAIRKQARPVDKILIVNNGSTDQTKTWLNEQPDLWIVHQENLGSAGGFHTGLKTAHHRGYGYYWLMDDDTIPEPSALAELLAAFQIDSTTAYACSRVLFPDGRTGNLPRLPVRWAPPSTLTHYLNHGLLPISACTFVSVLFTKSTVDKIGYPLSAMYIWGDDIEFTFRASQIGPAYVAGKSTVLHKTTSIANWELPEEDELSRIKLYHHKFRNDIYICLKYQNRLALFDLTRKLLGLPMRILFSNSQKYRKFLQLTRGLIETPGFIWNCSRQEPDYTRTKK